MATNTHPLRDILTGIQDPTVAVTIHTDAQSDTTTITHVTIDSRLVEPGSLYVALVGMTVDGHDYVAAAATVGAVAAIVSHTKAPELARAYGWSVVSVGAPPPAHWAGLLLIAVADPLTALQRWATWHRQRYNPPFVVGITGSVGKTSTKEFIGALLDDAMPTLRNPRSYNSESTLPLVALGLTAMHRAAVFEMGMYYPGDIATLCAIAHPNIAVITAVGPSHLERMGSIEAIAEAKAELVHAIPATGVVILNADDPIVAGFATRTKARVLTYGMAQHADVRAVDIEQRGLEGTEFRLIAPGIDDRVHLAAPGMHQVRNLLAAITVGIVAQVPWQTMRDTIAHRLPTVRFVVLNGIDDTQIIDDSYNAAPTSVRAALELLATVQRRRVAVLGDMRELGHIEEAAHREVGILASQCVDVLVTVGERGQYIAAGARDAGLSAVFEVQGTEAAIPVVRSVIAPRDCVLVKGSRAMAMEAIVTALCTQTTK